MDTTANAAAQEANDAAADTVSGHGNSNPAGFLIVRSDVREHLPAPVVRDALSCIGEGDAITPPGTITPVQALNIVFPPGLLTSYGVGENPTRQALSAAADTTQSPHPAANIHLRVTRAPGPPTHVVRRLTRHHDAATGPTQLPLATVSLQLTDSNHVPVPPRLTIQRHNQAAVNDLPTNERDAIGAYLDELPKAFAHALTLLPKHTVNLVVDHLLSRAGGVYPTEQHTTIYVPGNGGELVHAAQRFFHAVTAGLEDTHALDIQAVYAPLRPSLVPLITRAFNQTLGRRITRLGLDIALALSDDLDELTDFDVSVQIDPDTLKTLGAEINALYNLIVDYRDIVPMDQLDRFIAELYVQLKLLQTSTPVAVNA